MGIRINKKAKMRSIESRFELSFKRERIDIAKLLKEIKQGASLEIMFGVSIAASVSKMLFDDHLIDASNHVTPEGDQFIEYPYRNEAERGLYTLYLATIDFGLEKVAFVTKMERKLSNTDTPQESVNIKEVYRGNEFRLGSSEVGVLTNADNKSRSYCSNLSDSTILFDVTNGTFETEDGIFKMGEAIWNIAKRYVNNCLESEPLPFKYSADKNLALVTNLDEIEEKDLEGGVISNYKHGDIEFVSVPFEITDEDCAIKYAYFHIYHLIQQDNYFTISEMNEIFQNEIMSGDILAPNIKDLMANFKFTISGFEKYLSKERYSKMAYRLKVIKTLLDIDGIKDVDGFANAKSYPELLKMLQNKVSPRDVQRLYMVMGYAFAHNRKNQMVQCVNDFKSTYGNVIIVNKSPEGKVQEDESIKENIKSMGVATINKPEVDQLFHDRYLIFELKDGSYKTFLVTCEIGSIFNIETNETKGTLFEIPHTEIIKNNKSLINIVKE